MSISRSQRARLGVFVTAGAVLVAVLVTVSLGIKLSHTSTAYYALFQDESLSGLEQGALVKYTGVPIGKIEKISYLHNDLSKVKVTFAIESDFPMKKGMYATCGMLGITGLKYVEIMGGANDAAPLKPGAEIPTRVSMLSSISGKAETIIAKVELLLNHLNKLSEPDSLKSLRIMLDNIAAITASARTIAANITPKVDTMTDAATRVLLKVDKIAGDVKSFTGSLDSTVASGRFSQTVSRVDSTVIALKQLADNLSLMVRQSREDFTVSMQNLREASESASQLARMLAENPSLLLKGESQKERYIR
jgi:phospholipid/cholesterol/gamma-HCH transport system substrate-binding protein